VSGAWAAWMRRMSSNANQNNLYHHQQQQQQHQQHQQHLHHSLLELPSPNHIGHAPHHHHHHHEDGFSPEDIHHLLGDVLGGDDNEDGAHGGRSGPPSEAGSSVNVDANKNLARTERKRSREKQRRSDVNKQFHDLTHLLRRMETEDPDEFSHLPPYSPANRVELMGRTVQMLSVLYERNKKRKTEITDLQEQLEASKKAGEETAAKLKEAMMTPQSMGGNKVMMMVPMLINTGGDSSQPQSQQSSAQPPAMPFQSWMTSFMGMPTAAAATPAEFNPAAMAAAAAPHPMQMPFLMPMTMPAPTPASGAPSSSSGDLKQEAKTGSNLAHCA
jgi:hypothetical protein